MKKFAPLTLSLILAACGSTQTGGGNVTVSASSSAVTLAADGSSDTSTTYTFTNPAGARPTAVTSATVTWGTGAEQSATVAIPAITLPAGLSCAAAATNPGAACNYNDPGTTFGARSLTASISDSALFAKVQAANPSAKNLPVTVTFNGAANPVNLTLSVSSGGSGGSGGGGGGGGSAPVVKIPQPLITVNSTAVQPFSGTLNVTVAGNFDAASTVQSVILEITDSTGAVDNTTYISTQPTATFSVDTSRFPDGKLSLNAIALTKEGLRGESGVQSVNIRNITYPTITIPTPANGTTVTTPTLPVQINVTKRNTAFTVPGGVITVDLLDYRGVTVGSRTITGVTDNANGTYGTSFDIASLPADTYTLRVRTPILLSGSSAAQTIETVGQVSTNTTSLNPPSSVIRFPAVTTASSGTRAPATIYSGSGFLATVGDDKAVQYVEARIVGPFNRGNIADNGTQQCLESVPLGTGTPVNVLLLNVPGAPLLPYTSVDVFASSLDIDGSTYVPDSLPGQRYDLRVTVADAEGNRNIQCVPIIVSRAAAQAQQNYSVSTSTTPGIDTPNTTPGKLTYNAGTWTISGITNTSRVAAIIYKNGVRIGTAFEPAVQDTLDVSQSFSDPGTYEVKWLIEDLTTGVVSTKSGGVINVALNPG